MDSRMDDPKTQCVCSLLLAEAHDSLSQVSGPNTTKLGKTKADHWHCTYLFYILDTLLPFETMATQREWGWKLSPNWAHFGPIWNLGRDQSTEFVKSILGPNIWYNFVGGCLAGSDIRSPEVKEAAKYKALCVR